MTQDLREIPPLTGVRVLDLSRVLAGPYCCTLLAEQGAEVIKVERAGSGDENRKWGHLWYGVGVDFLNVNRGKRGLAVDLGAEKGRAIVRRLAAEVDVLVENFVPGTAARFGLAYEDLASQNPRLIYCSVTAYGEHGPLRAERGYDGAMQGFTGHMSITGEPDGGPVRTGASMIDMSTGLSAYSAIMTALFARERTGRGQKVSVSLLKTALALLGTHGAAYLNAGVLPRRAGSGVSHLAPYGAYASADGHVVIGVLNEASWERLCRILGLQMLLSDPSYADMQARVANRRGLDAAIGAVVRLHPTAYWCDLLSREGIVAAPVNTLREAFGHSQVDANAMITTVGEGTRALRAVSGPMDFASWRPAGMRPPPQLGEHTDAIMGELGYSSGDIRALHDRGVI